MTHINLKTIAKRLGLAVVGILVIYIGYIIVDASITGNTYVRIVDNSTDQAAPYPGADINAVEIRSKKSGSSTYATEVTKALIQDGEAIDANQFRDPSSSLADPQADQTPRYVSLGGGQLILHVPQRLRKGDSLIIYEIGADKGPTAEYYTVQTSTSADGPWEEHGSFAGLAEIVID